MYTHTHIRTQAMRVFFAIRALSQQVSGSEERELPLTMPSNSASVAEIVDLSKSARRGEGTGPMVAVVVYCFGSTTEYLWITHSTCVHTPHR